MLRKKEKLQIFIIVPHSFLHLLWLRSLRDSWRWCWPWWCGGGRCSTKCFFFCSRTFCGILTGGGGEGEDVWVALVLTGTGGPRKAATSVSTGWPAKATRLVRIPPGEDLLRPSLLLLALLIVILGGTGGGDALGCLEILAKFWNYSTQRLVRLNHFYTCFFFIMTEKTIKEIYEVVLICLVKDVILRIT